MSVEETARSGTSPGFDFNNASLLDAALEYARRGHAIHPVGRDKQPLTLHGFHDATTDELKIRAWWAKWPEANIAIATGPTLYTIDADNYWDNANGDTKVEDARREFFETWNIEEGVVVQTGNGGRQDWFAGNDLPSSTAKIAKHVDTRGVGGYTIAPPSVIDQKPESTGDGHYRFIMRGHALELPQFAKDYLRSLSEKQSPNGHSADRKLELVQQGTRNHDATRIAGWLHHNGLSDDDILAALKPITTLDESELQTIVGSISRYPADKTYTPNDDGQALFVADLYGDRIKFDWPTKTYYYYKPGLWWATDQGGKVVSYVREGARIRQNLAAEIMRAEGMRAETEIAEGIAKLQATVKDSKTLKRESAQLMSSVERSKKGGDEWNIALQMGNQFKIDSVHKALKDILGSKGIQWNPDPYKLGVANGVIDLKTGLLGEGRNEDLINQHLETIYDPEAKCPLWEQFFREILSDDAETINFLHRSFGYAITGLNNEDVYWYLYGRGKNGKSTAIQKVLLKILGTTANPDGIGMLAQVETFTKQHLRNSTRNDMAEMRGFRYVISNDVPQGAVLDEQRLKEITGGEMRGRLLYQNNLQFRSQVKLFLQSNYEPTIPQNDDGTWRRFLLVDFKRQFEIDTTLEARLLAESQGILTWLVRGAMLYINEGGLQVPEKVRTRVDEFRDRSDMWGDLIDDRYDLDLEYFAMLRAGNVTRAPLFQTQGAAVGAAANAWLFQQGIKENPSKIKTILSERYPGIYKRGATGAIYLGLKLKRRPE